MAGENMAMAQGDTAELMNAASIADQVAERMQQHATTLSSRLAPLEQAWMGTSAAAFQSIHTDYQASANKLNMKLRELAVQIRRTAQAHESADQFSNQKLANASGGQSAPSLSASLNA